MLIASGIVPRHVILQSCSKAGEITNYRYSSTTFKSNQALWRPMNTDNTITAIILCYWEERLGHISKIIDTLRNNTFPPTNIIVFNNNPDLNDVYFEHAITINSGENFYCYARHVASLFYNTKYYYFQDDDLVVENLKLLQILSELLIKHPELVVKHPWQGYHPEC